MLGLMCQAFNVPCQTLLVATVAAMIKQSILIDGTAWFDDLLQFPLRLFQLHEEYVKIQSNAIPYRKLVRLSQSPRHESGKRQIADNYFYIVHSSANAPNPRESKTVIESDDIQALCNTQYVCYSWRLLYFRILNTIGPFHPPRCLLLIFCPL